MIITLDGPAAAGKGTISRQVTNSLKYTYLDVGLIFRAISYMVIEGIIPKFKSESDIRKVLVDDLLEYKWINDDAEIRIDGILVTSKLTNPTIAQYTSEIASQEDSMLLLNICIQEIARSHTNIVCDGRHTGSVIFPRARLKYFVTASVETRATRRYQDLSKQGHTTNYVNVLSELRERDLRDKQRAFAPLIHAKDARILDTDKYSIQDSVDQIIADVSNL